MLTLFNASLLKHKRKLTSSDLEDAIIRDDTDVLSKLLQHAKRVPPHYLELAVCNDRENIFEMLKPLVHHSDWDQIVQSNSLPAAAIKQGQFDMFVRLVTHYKLPFRLDSLLDMLEAPHFSIKALRFLTTTLFTYDDKSCFKAIKVHNSEASSAENGPVFIDIADIIQEDVFNSDWLVSYVFQYFEYTTSQPVDVDHINRFKTLVWNSLPNYVQDVTLETIQFILEHPDCPADLPERFITQSFIDSNHSPYGSSLPVIQYLHNKYDLVSTFQNHVSTAEYYTPCAPFEIALANQRFDICDELLRIGFKPNHRCWKGDHDIEQLKYLQSLGIPFTCDDDDSLCYLKDYQRVFQHYIMPYDFDDCQRKYKQLFEYMLDIKLPLMPADKKHQLYSTAIPSLLNMIDYSCWQTSRSISKLSQMYSSATVARIVEVIQILLDHGCKFINNVSLAENLKIPVLDALNHFSPLTSDDLHTIVQLCTNSLANTASQSNSLDCVCHVLSKYRLRLRDTVFNRAMNFCNDFRAKCNDKYWYDDLHFRHFMMETFDPVRHACNDYCHDCEHYCGDRAQRNIQKWEGLYLHFNAYCDQVKKLVNRVSEINDEYDLLLPNIISDVVAAYL